MDLFSNEDPNYKNSTTVSKWYPPKKVKGKIILTLRPKFRESYKKPSKGYQKKKTNFEVQLRSSTSKMVCRYRQKFFYRSIK